MDAAVFHFLLLLVATVKTNCLIMRGFPGRNPQLIRRVSAPPLVKGTGLLKLLLAAFPSAMSSLLVKLRADHAPQHQLEKTRLTQVVLTISDQDGGARKDRFCCL